MVYLGDRTSRYCALSGSHRSYAMQRSDPCVETIEWDGTASDVWSQSLHKCDRESVRLSSAASSRMQALKLSCRN